MNDADLLLLKGERLRQEIRAENRRFILQLLFAIGAGVVAGHYFWR
jgi:hypothetical protein